MSWPSIYGLLVVCEHGKRVSLLSYLALKHFLQRIEPILYRKIRISSKTQAQILLQSLTTTSKTVLSLHVGMSVHPRTTVTHLDLTTHWALDTIVIEFKHLPHLTHLSITWKNESHGRLQFAGTAPVKNIQVDLAVVGRDGCSSHGNREAMQSKTRRPMSSSAPPSKQLVSGEW